MSAAAAPTASVDVPNVSRHFPDAFYAWISIYTALILSKSQNDWRFGEKIDQNYLQTPTHTLFYQRQVGGVRGATDVLGFMPKNGAKKAVQIYGRRRFYFPAKESSRCAKIWQILFRCTSKMCPSVQQRVNPMEPVWCAGAKPMTGGIRGQKYQFH